MILEIGNYRLEIDPERTAAFYAAQSGITCGCAGCRNYERAALSLPEQVLGLFSELGIDPAKPAEVYVNCAGTADTVYYGGFYHICGAILSDTNPWVPVTDRCFRFDEACRIRLSDCCSVFFTEQVHLLEEGFPSPVIQMEIDFTLPWMLEEPNAYF